MAYDAIVVGAGHNGLVCACYLARAGLRVLVLERRDVVGGAAASEELVPGFRFDVGAVAHVLIRATPVLRDLDMGRFGLRYHELDPWGFVPSADGPSFFFYRDVDRTCESMAAVSPPDAEAYRRFVRRWAEIVELLLPSFLTPPGLLSLPLAVAMRRPRLLARYLRPGVGPAAARDVLSGYGRVIRETFRHDLVRGALAQLSATAGLGPEEPGGSVLLGWHALWHRYGVWRPDGGSGALCEALAAYVRAAGGEVRTGTEVTRVDATASGVRGVEVAGGGRFEAPVVVANAHVQAALLDLLDPWLLPGRLRRRVAALDLGAGTGMTVQCATEALPRYASAPRAGLAPWTGLQVLCPSLEHLERAYGDARAGRPAAEPSMYVITPSATDGSLAGPGRHTAYLWGQCFPYHLAGEDGGWEAAREREADRLVARLEAYAPGFADSVVGRFVQTPLDLERRLGLRGGNCMHVSLTLGQMFTFRPLPELSGYRTPVPGLYLTGAGTHPIGGVTGMPGFNTARRVLADVRRGR